MNRARTSHGRATLRGMSRAAGLLSLTVLGLVALAAVLVALEAAVGVDFAALWASLFTCGAVAAAATRSGTT
jgi:hypothetical protein